MTTPDDPVIHSPPSLRGGLSSGLINGTSNLGSLVQRQPTVAAAAAGLASLQTSLQTPTGLNLMDDLTMAGGGVRPSGSTGCEQPTNHETPADDSQRRQKTCRVCGDHATGYNFNVITCESCKAFFRRNALRPKEFKCPYSDDCDINSVSRRFCQKCRLRKCFAVGMKKEWILNEEQLRRRKNSRLNHMTSSGQSTSRPTTATSNAPAQTVTASSINTTNPIVGRRYTDQTMILSPSSSTISPTILPTSPDSPNRAPRIGLPQIETNGDAQYESNMMRLQRQQAAGAFAALRPNGFDPTISVAASLPTAPSSSLTRPTDQYMLRSEPHITMSVDEYQALLKAARAGVGPLPNLPNQTGGIQPIPSFDDAKRDPYSASGQQRPIMNIGIIRPTILQGSTVPHYTDLGVTAGPVQQITSFKPPELDDIKPRYIGTSLTEELVRESPRPSSEPGALRQAICREGDYQLNSAERNALDIVTNAFACLNEQLDDPKQEAHFKKQTYTPTDVLNMTDVTMRRLVKAAKKLPAFNDLTHSGKFALLKNSMIEMLILRGVLFFDLEHKCWRSDIVPGSTEVSIGIFDQLNENVHDRQREEYLSFYQSLHPDIRHNETAISVLMLIVLFDSSGSQIADLQDQKICARHYHTYYSLLYRYLESLYGVEARLRYCNIPDCLRMLKTISKNATTIFLGCVDLDVAEPLPREFFITKPTAE
uniref:Nuclear receptor domain-containing protein n=1 Tax=Syphacia muris TaxID=451379 RepID=A0A0N5AYH9_9BILA